MFDWIGDLIDSVVGAIQDGFEWIGEVLLGQIWNTMMQWLYETVYTAVADFFSLIGNMGADIFNLSWVQATVELFTLFGWALFVAGVVVAIFDVAIEYQNGRADIKSCAINILKGFFACSLIGVVPIELYKFCITLQNTFASELAAYAGSTQSFDLSITAQGVLVGSFFAGNLSSQLGLFTLLCLIAFGYCVVKIFFQNIKRGGILLVQMSVGALYMFSVPRGYIENLFTDFEEKDTDVQIPDNEESSYKITVEFYRDDPRIIEGTYDKQGLPTDWPEFIEALYGFMSFYGFGEMFDEAHYGRTYRKNGDYIFLSVRFGDYGKTYYYLTEDSTIEVGDQVVVPVGNDGTERIVEVVKIEYFAPDRVPMPIEKVKSIIGKFTHPLPNEDGHKMIFCPMCEKEIHEDDCFDILYDPLTKEIPGIITEEEIKAKSDICKRCRYHDE